jgi:hypothetical protein
MRRDIVHLLGRFVRRRVSIRRRLFWLLTGMSLMILLVVNLVWLPDTIHDIHETYGELQYVAARGVRDQIESFLNDKKEEIQNHVRRLRPAFLAGDYEVSINWDGDFWNERQTLWRLASSMLRGKSRSESLAR